MDIRQATDAEKQTFFEKAECFFEAIRLMVDTLEKDIKSEDLVPRLNGSIWLHRIQVLIT